MKRLTPHLIAAGVLVVIVLALTVGKICCGPGSYPILNQELCFPERHLKPVLPAETLLGPVVPAASGERLINPFSLRAETTGAQVKIGTPPPPELELPALPALPLPGDAP